MAELVAIIAPVFLIIALGFVLGRARIFGAEHAHVLTNFTWYVAIPFLLFRSLAPRELPSQEEMLIVAAYYLALYGIYALSYWGAGILFHQSQKERPVFAFLVCFGNAGFIGIPIIEEAYGIEGVRILLIILSFHSMTLLPVSTFLTERALGSAGGIGIARRTFDTMRKSPIMVSLFFASGWAALGLPFPYWLDRVTALPAASAAPVGLFAVGLSMRDVKISGDLAQAITMAALKLVLLPLAVYVVARYGFGLSHLWVGVATVTASLPTGVIAYNFASQYDVAPRRAASAVMISTVASVFTLSAVLLLLGIGR